MSLKRSDLVAAVQLWFQHRKWEQLSVLRVPGMDDGTSAAAVTGLRDDKWSTVLCVQHRVYFDQMDFEGRHPLPHFAVPAMDYSYQTGRGVGVLVFNMCRTWCAWIEPFAYGSSVVLADGRRLIHPIDLKFVEVPWRLWAMDCLPEWQQRGWPNPNHHGTAGDRDSWLWHPCWAEDVLREADPYRRLPVKWIDGDPPQVTAFNSWRAQPWYRAWLESGNDQLLPWHPQHVVDAGGAGTENVVVG